VPERWDVIVAGLGAMGGAAARALARRGLRVLGLDRYAPPHAHGSTHGRTRITREAYFEHPAYVPLVQRASNLWDELERESGTPLFVRTGGLMIGPETGDLVRGAGLSASEHGLPHEWLSADDVRERFPALAPDPQMVALYEPRAGVLFVEACLRAMLHSAAAAGAELRMGEPMLSWRTERGIVRVATAVDEYLADKLVLTVGPWLAELVGNTALSVTVERQTQHWLASANGDATSPQRMPITIWETTDPALDRLFYTIPDFGDGVKIAVHHGGEVTDPSRVRRTIGEDDVMRVRALADRFLHGTGDVRESVVCLYTNTRDGHFLIDTHPVHNEIFIVSACSGHGFKFAPAIGEIVANELTGAAPVEELSLFRLRRLT
jgi:sarcosine oxidase